MKKIAIGCDPNAKDLKEIIKRHLFSLGYEYEDYGSDAPIYANVAIFESLKTPPRGNIR